MSALGHKQTYAVQNGMSALPPIADICSAQAMSALCQKRTSFLSSRSQTAALERVSLQGSR